MLIRIKTEEQFNTVKNYLTWLWYTFLSVDWLEEFEYFEDPNLCIFYSTNTKQMDYWEFWYDWFIDIISFDNFKVNFII